MKCHHLKLYNDTIYVILLNGFCVLDFLFRGKWSSSSHCQSNGICSSRRGRKYSCSIFGKEYRGWCIQLHRTINFNNYKRVNYRNKRVTYRNWSKKYVPLHLLTQRNTRPQSRWPIRPTLAQIIKKIKTHTNNYCLCYQILKQCRLEFYKLLQVSNNNHTIIERDMITAKLIFEQLIIF